MTRKVDLSWLSPRDLLLKPQNLTLSPKKPGQLIAGHGLEAGEVALRVNPMMPLPMIAKRLDCQKARFGYRVPIG